MTTPQEFQVATGRIEACRTWPAPSADERSPDKMELALSFADVRTTLRFRLPSSAVVTDLLAAADAPSIETLGQSEVRVLLEGSIHVRAIGHIREPIWAVIESPRSPAYAKAYEAIVYLERAEQIRRLSAARAQQDALIGRLSQALSFDVPTPAWQVVVGTCGRVRHLTLLEPLPMQCAGVEYVVNRMTIFPLAMTPPAVNKAVPPIGLTLIALNRHIVRPLAPHTLLDVEILAWRRGDEARLQAAFSCWRDRLARTLAVGPPSRVRPPQAEDLGEADCPDFVGIVNGINESEED